jgi:outer membrane protein TolC
VRIRPLVAACTIVVTLAGAAHGQSAPPLGLRDAVAEALRNSPELAAPHEAVATAEIQRRQAGAPFGLRVTPNVSRFSTPGGYDTRVAGVSVGKTLTTGTELWLSGSSNDFTGAGTRYHDRGYSVGVSQPLTALFSHAVAAPLEDARREVRRMERRLDGARQQLIVDVAEAYYAVVTAERLRDVALRARDRASALVAASEARARAGLDTQLDVMRAQLLASQAQTGVADREDTMAAARERLNVLLGRSIDADVDLAPEEPIVVPSDDVSALMVSALKARVEVVDARARIEDARRALVLAHWNVMPPVALNVEYSQRGLGTPLQPLYRPFNGWHVSLTSSYGLDRATQAASIEASALAVSAAERQSRDVEQRISAEVRQAARAVARADAALDQQRQARAIAQRQVELARLRYERGLADNLTVVDAENALFQAESASITAGVERYLSRLRLERAAGTLGSTWQP